MLTAQIRTFSCLCQPNLPPGPTSVTIGIEGQPAPLAVVENVLVASGEATRDSRLQELDQVNVIWVSGWIWSAIVLPLSETSFRAMIPSLSSRTIPCFI